MSPRTIILDQHDRIGVSPERPSKETVELLQIGDEIAAALGRAGMDDEFARDSDRSTPASRPSWPAPAPAPASLPPTSPRRGEVGMRQRLALIAVEKTNVPASACCLRSCRRRPTRSTSLSVYVPSACAGVDASRTCFRTALDSCERLMRTPSRASISARRRGIVQFRRSATVLLARGDDAHGGFTLHPRRAWRGARLQRCDTAGGDVAAPQANRIFAHAKRLRDLGAGPTSQRQKHGARRSASPRSRELARARRPARCSSLAVTGDFPAMPYTLRIGAVSQPQKTYPLVMHREDHEGRLKL